MTNQKTLCTVLVAVGLAGFAIAADTQRADDGAAARDVRPNDSSPKRDRQDGHLEMPGPDTLWLLPAPLGTSPGGRVERNGYVAVQVNVDDNGNNIIGDAGNEPSIAVDPVDRTRMAIGWRQFDTIASDFRQAGWGWSDDGGQTWTFPGRIEAGVFRSDPVLRSDADGVFYYNSLTAEGYDFWCHVYISTDGGMTWDDGHYAEGGDKQWMAIDQTDGIGRGNIYAHWTRSWSVCNGDFTDSYDGGYTFQDCIEVPDNPQWGTSIVGPNGEVYVCGAGYGDFTVAMSSTLQDPMEPPAWDWQKSVNLGGDQGFSTGPNPGGLLGQAWIGVDRSGGPSHGNLYLCCSVDPGGSDPLDVMFSRSTDGGLTWSSPVRLNDDTGNAWQWFATMSVAPNGRIDVIWNDTRNDPGGYDSELYYTFSEDAGVTWSVNEVLTPAFDPHIGWPQQNKMGDYFDMHSDNLGADLAFSATFNGEQDVYFMRIGQSCTDAGTVRFDKDGYACESEAVLTVSDCGLNTDDGMIETVEIDVDSDSEPGGESVVLTEVGPAAAVFEGTITLSETDAPGVLLVHDGDTVTATYIDADDGQGGYDIEVTATAEIDCDAPVISDVTISGIGPRQATVQFTTDEPAYGAVRYGLSCDMLDEIEASSDLVTEHEITIIGLEPETVYYLAVEATDEAGGTAIDDDGGECYSFTTLEGALILLVDDDDNSPDVRSYYTETLDALGVWYDIWDTNNSDDEPLLADLAGYTSVIWFTGDEFGGFCGPGGAGEAALADWLNAGGCMFISAQDYFYDRGLTGFMTSHLGVQNMDSDVSQDVVTGVGSVFAGLGPYSLDYSMMSNYSDEIYPDATAEVAFDGDSGNAAVNKDGEVYRTVFLGFAFETLPTETAREEVMQAYLDICGDLFPDCPADITGEGVVDVLDLLAVLATWGPCDPPCPEDINGDGVVDVLDLLEVLSVWGPCD